MCFMLQQRIVHHDERECTEALEDEYKCTELPGPGFFFVYDSFTGHERRR